MKNLTTLLLCCAVATLSAQQMPIYLDASQPIEKRIEDALSQMTLEEKVAMCHAQSKLAHLVYPDLVSLKIG